MQRLVRDSVVLAAALQLTILIVAPGYGMTFWAAQPYAWGLTAVYVAVIAIKYRKK
jgi:hypothetical protein